MERKEISFKRIEGAEISFKNYQFEIDLIGSELDKLNKLRQNLIEKHSKEKEKFFEKIKINLIKQGYIETTKVSLSIDPKKECIIVNDEAMNDQEISDMVDNLKSSIEQFLKGKND